MRAFYLRKNKTLKYFSVKLYTRDSLQYNLAIFSHKFGTALREFIVEINFYNYWTWNGQDSRLIRILQSTNADNEIYVFTKPKKKIKCPRNASNVPQNYRKYIRIIWFENKNQLMNADEFVRPKHSVYNHAPPIGRKLDNTA